MERIASECANDFYSYLTGSENIYRYFPNHFLTEGVKEIGTKEECFWFIDIILSYQMYNEIESTEIQIWSLERINGTRFIVHGKDEDENILVTQKIDFTDFYFQKLELKLSNKIIFLPSEE